MDSTFFGKSIAADLPPEEHKGVYFLIFGKLSQVLAVDGLSDMLVCRIFALIWIGQDFQQDGARP